MGDFLLDFGFFALQYGDAPFGVVVDGGGKVAHGLLHQPQPGGRGAALPLLQASHETQCLVGGIGGHQDIVHFAQPAFFDPFVQISGGRGLAFVPEAGFAVARNAVFQQQAGLAVGELVFLGKRRRNKGQHCGSVPRTQ